MLTPPLSRLCIHTITAKPLRLGEAIASFKRVGATGITVWRDPLLAAGVSQGAKMLADSGLRVVSLCRGGFFPAADAAGKQKALDDNRQAIDQAAAIGAPLVVLVCGAVPRMPLAEGRKQIAEGIAAVLPHAQAAGVKLGIEPLHPMYADARSAISTLGQANDIVEQLNSKFVGVTLDVFHIWWDERLESEIARAGRRGSIFSFHVCDWLSPTRDMLNDRGLMGEGCIPIRQIRSWVEAAGFNGPIEAEIFSDRWWATDQQAFLDRIRQAYLECV